MAGKSNKTMYHSEAVKSGTFEAEVRSEPTPSKYKDKPPFVMLKINGSERYYECENDACKKALTGLKGQTVQITATGGRDDAELYVTSSNGEPIHRGPSNGGSPRQQQAAADTRAASGESKPEKEAREFAAFSQAKVYCGRCACLWQIASRHADLLMPIIYDVNALTIEAQSDLHMRLTNTLYIETKGVTPIHDLPLHWSDEGWQPKATGEAPPKPAPKPPPPKPAVPSEEDDEIPF